MSFYPPWFTWCLDLKYLALAVFLSLVPRMESEDRLIGSSEPIRAPLGGDVILPCFAQPQINMEGMTVIWWRPDIPVHPNWYVHLHPEKQHQEAQTMPSYAGRTEMFADGLKLVNASLRIRNLKLSDDGRYRCFISQLGRGPIIKLEVFDRLIGSSEPIRAPLGGDVILPCVLQPQINMENVTVMWSRPDIPVDPNRYVHRHLGPDEAQKMASYVGRTEMFPDGLTLGNGSLRIRNLQLSDDGSYRCVIPQLALDTTIKLEVFGSRSYWCFFLVLSIFIVLLAVGAAGYFLKLKFQRPYPPDCSDPETKPPPSKYSRASIADAECDTGTDTDTDTDTI
ncbi:butyrophilin subfamily 1 member A1-like [Pseudochaenichthys georgianus]|uniref:butyrophilin subfamily 1 member A1-like n=1 Tax=Pseudochaenichthys georgianus TaxID=52239 RepID=UPI001469F8B0|nr:butyrophilin subfamily 1 member A1-like [Pseudochaenichthys georgianus]